MIIYSYALFFSFSTSIMYMGVSKNRGKTPKSSHLFIGFSIIFTIHIGWFGGTIIFGNTHINIYSILIYSYSLFCWFSFTRQLVLFILNIHISTMVLLLYKHTSQRQWHWTWNQKFNWRSHAFTFLNVETPELHQLCFEGTKMHLQAVKHQVEGQGWVTFTWWNVTHPYEFWFGESVRLMNPYEIFQFGLVKLMNPYEIFHFGWWNLWILMKSSILVGETYESLWNLPKVCSCHGVSLQPDFFCDWSWKVMEETKPWAFCLGSITLHWNMHPIAPSFPKNLTA